jgi:hypothetical protein
MREHAVDADHARPGDLGTAPCGVLAVLALDVKGQH